MTQNFVSNIVFARPTLRQCYRLAPRRAIPSAMLRNSFPVISFFLLVIFDGQRIRGISPRKESPAPSVLPLSATDHCASEKCP
jgi:hypothetical protein